MTYYLRIDKNIGYELLKFKSIQELRKVKNFMEHTRNVYCKELTEYQYKKFKNTRENYD
jgi:hypothetical protein